MSRNTKLVIGGVAVGLLTLFFLPWWLSTLLVLAVLATPVVMYKMLDPSQRDRLKRIRARNKQLGR